MADELFEKLQFTVDEREVIKKMVKDIYGSLLFRKAVYLLPLEKEMREKQRMQFLKQEIDNNRLFMIYCFNIFAELQSVRMADSKDELRFFSTPIENVLETDDFYNKLIHKKNLPIGDRIAILQKKTKRSYKATQLLFADAFAKIEKTALKILHLVNIRDPFKLSVIMLFVINTLSIAETELMDSVLDKKEPENPCDANKYFGKDWSFLGIFKPLPNGCQEYMESTKISVVNPIQVTTKVGGRKTRKHR